LSNPAVKTQRVSSAAEAAVMILRIDDIIASSKAPYRPPGAGGPGGMGGMPPVWAITDHHHPLFFTSFHFEHGNQAGDAITTSIQPLPGHRPTPDRTTRRSPAVLPQVSLLRICAAVMRSLRARCAEGSGPQVIDHVRHAGYCFLP
jgi:hypothetical protein